MRCRLQILTTLAAVSLVGVAGKPSTAAAGSPVQLSAGYYLHWQDPVTLSDDELNAITGQLDSAVRFQEKQTGWRCVGQTGTDPTTIDKMITFHMEYLPASDDPNAIQVNGEVILAGKVLATGSRTIYPGQIDPANRAPTLAGTSRAALVDALNASSPCTPRVKMKGKHHIKLGMLMDVEVDGDAQIALQDDGSFSGSMPVRFNWSPIQTSSAMCTVGAGSEDSSATFAGAFDDSDASLAFTSMAIGDAEAPPMVAECAGVGNLVSGLTGPTLRHDIAQATDLRIALRDAAENVLQFDTPIGSYECTLDLSYQSDGQDVAVDRPD